MPGTDNGGNELPGLPAAPPPGASALPAGTFNGIDVFVSGAGTGLGKAIAAEFARLGAGIVIASRKPEHLAAGGEAMEEI
ncbi:MAG: 3-oxoacyl-[acyl-carrier protein] reductase, partial [Ilumatobacteraceae bacterium]|nr:3-oxoacyl-[acyl-carrier protein] reductase [Ilumatobacteraceae bacterium]